MSEIEELWHGMAPPYLDLLAWLDQRGPKPVSGALSPFRPPMLAHPLLSKAERIEAADLDPSLISPTDFAAEWKWDGVRVQLAADKGVRRLYTRNGDDISKTFPDLLEAADFDAAIDGELLIRSPQGGIASFNELQQRLNRKLVSPKQMTERPAMLRAYDKQTGKEVGAVFMPSTQSGSPMTYMVNGKQYIIVPTSGGNASGEFLAYALPSKR